MFRLLNVLISDRFYEAFLAVGHQLSRAEIDQGGSTFWSDVATAFGADTSEFSTLITLYTKFEGVDASFAMAHSAAKLKRMWGDVSRNLAATEAKSKVSGEGSNDFWDFCGGRADVYYLDHWCDHRQGGQEFCSTNLYPDDEDNSTKEGWEVTKQHVNRKRRKRSQSADIFERVSELLEMKTKEEIAAMQKDTCNEQKLFIREQRAAQKLTALYSMLDRSSAVTQ
ncbi:Hypothetical protein PHPALM_1307 [Phytophthora palmivora]|uniref:Uncharacterized protein n=1 Tax=Phytophthora palmivora TaxID=4796 RepID=A0A2P4YSN2_9STRA|nr:Hypothetical protein PHPALM_1307 [Phytophthora palmivora]